MTPKRVTDVSSDYQDTPARPASNAEITRIRRAAKKVKAGKLERDVDALLGAKGLALDSSLADAVKELGRQPFGGKKAPPFKKKRKSATTTKPKKARKSKTSSRRRR